MRRGQPHWQASLFYHPVPAADPGDRVLDEVVAQHLVERVEHGHFLLRQLSVLHRQHLVGAALQAVIVVAFGFVVSALDAGVVEILRRP